MFDEENWSTDEMMSFTHRMALIPSKGRKLTYDGPTEEWFRNGGTLGESCVDSISECDDGTTLFEEYYISNKRVTYTRFYRWFKGAESNIDDTLVIWKPIRLKERRRESLMKQKLKKQQRKVRDSYKRIWSV